MRKTKIVCTIGPASESVETLRELMLAGMSVARINFSHGGIEEQEEKITNIKKVREELGLPIALMLDTKGPEIRTGKLQDGKVTLIEGEELVFTLEEILGDKNRVTVDYVELHNEVAPGTLILIDDGSLETVVERIEGTDIVCKITHGGSLGSRKSINVPGLKSNLPSLTAKDVKDITDGINYGFDFIAASFVRRKQDVLDIRNLLDENGGSEVKIISKIENREGIDNFDEILEVSDGIMVARGDLSVEVPMEEVPILQKQFIKKCYKSGKQVITATQMLESMMNNPRPTRAEVSDIANSVFDMTSAIMLSGESAMGKHPVECVKTMVRISTTIENSIKYWKRFKERDIDFEKQVYEYKINYSTCFAAMNMNAKAIFSFTETGDTPRMVSSFTPCCPVYAVTKNERTYNQLAITFGVMPLLYKDKTKIDDLLRAGIEEIKAKGDIQEGDIVIIAGGSSMVKNMHDNELNKIMGGALKV